MYDMPMPDTCDPYYADQADSIRSLMSDSSRSAIRVMVDPSEWSHFGEGPIISRLVALSIIKAWAFAPWTEQPAVYVWRCVIDSSGRAVCGPAELALKPEGWSVV